MLSPEIAYQALTSRDTRFDGVFFVGATSTGIYCRPVCPVKAPMLKNCLFFSSAEAVANLGQLAGAPGGPSAGPAGASAGAPAGAPTVGPDWSRSQALATHPRIAQAARALGWAEVSVVPGPLQAVVEAVRLRAARLQSAPP